MLEAGAHSEKFGTSRHVYSVSSEADGVVRDGANSGGLSQASVYGILSRDQPN